jgi:hypothetical protein
MGVAGNRADVVSDMLHGVVGGALTSPSRASHRSLRFGNTVLDAHPSAAGRQGRWTAGGGAFSLGPSLASIGSVGGVASSRSLASLANLPSGRSVAPARRITVADLKRQVATSKASGGAAGSLSRTYTNGDVAQYAVLVAVFAPYAEEEWSARGGLYLLGKGGSHEFVAAVIHRLVAHYYFGIRDQALPAMLATHALRGRPSKFERAGASVEGGLRYGAGSISGGSGSLSTGGLEFASSEAHSSVGSLEGGGAALMRLPLAPGGGNGSGTLNAFDSLPALLGDEWNEALLRCIYHYFFRAHTGGCVPLFGELLPEEARWRRQQAEAVRTFRRACKALASAAREHTARLSVAASRRYTASGDAAADAASLRERARQAAARMAVQREKLAAAKAVASARDVERVKAAASRRHLSQLGRRLEREKVAADAWRMEAAELRRGATEGAAEAEARARQEAQRAGLNPDSYLPHVRRALYAAGLASVS